MNALLLSALVLAGCGEDVDVRGGRDGVFDVDARGASVREVIDCLSERAGFSVVFDPAAYPPTRVTLRLTGQSAGEAIRTILDGQGLNYAYTSKPESSKVLMLIVSTRAPRPSGSADPPPSGRSVAPAASERGFGFDRRNSGLPSDSGRTAPAPSAPPSSPPANTLDRVRGAAPASPAEVPLYVEPRPLTPLSLSEVKRTPVRDRF